MARQAPQAPVARAAEAVSFNIPSGQLDAVLKALGSTAQLTFDVQIPADTVGMMHSPGVSGTFTIDEALRRVLDGTSLTFRRSGSVVTIEIARLNESVEVTGRISTVSTPKLTEPLRDIPQTITVIPRAVMDEQGATTLRDVLRNVAGITFQAGEGGVPAGDQLSIRGFSARTDMFVDGVRDFGGYSRDSFNMEQVEVAKGPTSTLAGRGSTGGAINQVSKAPGLSPIAEATVGAGNASYQRTTLDFNQPLATASNSRRVDSRQRDVDRHRGAESRPRRIVAVGRGAVDWLRQRHQHPRHGQLFQAEAGQPARVRLAVGTGQHQSGVGGVRQRRAHRSTSRTSTGWSPATTRRPTPTWRRRMSRMTSGGPPSSAT